MEAPSRKCFYLIAPIRIFAAVTVCSTKYSRVSAFGKCIPFLINFRRETACSFQQVAPARTPTRDFVTASLVEDARCRFQQWRLSMSDRNYYDDFADFGKNNEDDSDEDDDETMSEEDKARIEMFRTQMMRGNVGGLELVEGETNPEDDEEDEIEGTDYGDENFVTTEGKSFSSVDDLISFASSGGTAVEEAKATDWAVPLLEDPTDTAPGVLNSALRGGAILIANPSRFCSGFSGKSSDTLSGQPSASLLSKFGLTLPPPAELGPDRQADLLPVLMVLERHPLRGSHAVLLNRRTGYLLGDLEQQQQQQGGGRGEGSNTVSGNLPAPKPRLGAFMIQPLWFGGTSAGSNGAGGGLDMLHQCPAVRGCKRLTEDGLYWGGDPIQAQEAMSNPGTEDGRPLTGFEFKFFVQSTRWLPTQLEKEVRDGTWFIASVSKEVLFKSRDRLGTKRAKPLWTEIMELLGGKYQEIRDELYKGG